MKREKYTGEKNALKVIYVVMMFESFPPSAEDTSSERCEPPLILAWFSDKDKAAEAVMGNTADINECGTYPYALIKEVPEGTFYPYTRDTKTRQWFRFDEEHELYYPMPEPEGTRFI